MSAISRSSGATPTAGRPSCEHGSRPFSRTHCLQPLQLPVTDAKAERMTSRSVAREAVARAGEGSLLAGKLGRIAALLHQGLERSSTRRLSVGRRRKSMTTVIDLSAELAELTMLRNRTRQTTSADRVGNSAQLAPYRDGATGVSEAIVALDDRHDIVGCNPVVAALPASSEGATPPVPPMPPGRAWRARSPSRIARWCGRWRTSPNSRH